MLPVPGVTTNEPVTALVAHPFAAYWAQVMLGVPGAVVSTVNVTAGDEAREVNVVEVAHALT